MRNSQQKLKWAAEQVRDAEKRLRTASPADKPRLERHRLTMQRTLDRIIEKEANRVAKQAAKRLERQAQPTGKGNGGLKRSGPLKQGKPLPAVNAARRAKAREEQFSIADGYHRHTRESPCAYCGRWSADTARDPAHMIGVDLGGKAADVIPLCHFGTDGPNPCPGHVWQETHKKEFDRLFEERHGMPPLDMARALRAAYLLSKGEQ